MSRSTFIIGGVRVEVDGSSGLIITNATDEYHDNAAYGPAADVQDLQTALDLAFDEIRSRLESPPMTE